MRPNSSPLSGRMGCVDGTLMPVEEVRIPASDPGFARGDGVFEAVRCYGGQPFALREHLARLAASASNVQLEYDADALARECASFCRRTSRDDCHVRILVTRWGTRLVLEEPLIEYRDGVRLALVPHVLTPLLIGVKSLSYAAHMQAQRVAREQGADESLFIDAASGDILEAPFSSFVWVEGGKMYTPPLSLGILDSITRRVLLEVADIVEAQCTTDDLKRATEACLVGTTREVQAVGEIAGIRTFSSESPTVAALQGAYRAYVEQAVGRATSGAGETAVSARADERGRDRHRSTR